ncbi:MAG: DEAD/DEAH box helicase family protein [Ignavibacteria bacterium]|nr:DEAD/DEAH box helicase family protein [Ignavibacteria bacterium]
MARTRRTNNQVKLKDSLLLNQFILNLFGANSFAAFSKELKDSRLEGYDENNISYFYHELISRLFTNDNIQREQLLEYDQNIYRHSKQISEKQHKAFSWKYFQYLSLLFTEIYLDKYFSGADNLLQTLNDFVDTYNTLDKPFVPTPFAKTDLNKLAFWNATGSGKTLIMHVNILQYLHYANKHKKAKDLNRIILLTPNEGLSKQHLVELQKSGFEAELFNKQASGLFGGTIIEIIDIHKLEDKDGEKTVAIESFEGNNLVLVDEGHRGASGDDWKVKRDKLSENGFSFEYSATFGQAVAAAPAGKRDTLLHEYSKCTIFDYSYKYFYEDGYGKDYSILNLNDTWNQHTIDLYLAASLLNYYQQVRIFEEHAPTLHKFLLEKPLMIFVGSSVTAVRTEKGNQVSDVINILQFLRDFIKNRSAGIDAIQRLLTGRSGLIDGQNRPIFHNSFAYLASLRLEASECYDDILKRIFNSSISGAELHLDNLKGADGEIGLRVGDAAYFGVINVGDDSKLLKLCEDNQILTAQKDFSDSLFHSINAPDSQLNILIGSKKFTEGWNSWRVSTMGLMNVGKGEGTEIIQLFGRGVRLKGFNFSLKRSDKLDFNIRPDDIPKYIKYIETLYVFGIRADYMQQFKEYLEEEGLPTNDSNFEELSIPVLPAIELIENKKLKILKVKDGVDFKKDVQFTLYPPQSGMQLGIKVDWYPKIQILHKSSSKQSNVNDSRATGKLQAKHTAFLNWDDIYFSVQKYKNERNWYNMSISKKTLQDIMTQENWYTLFIPEYELEVNNVQQIQTWQEIAISLLKTFCDKLYNYEKNKYLSQFLEYQILDINHPNFIQEYKLLIERTEEELIEKLKELKDALNEDTIADFVSFDKVANMSVFEFSQHLYKPLIYVKKGEYQDTLSISPVHLVESEKKFVDDLKAFYLGSPEFFQDKEMYLLRNLSRKGVSFFEANNFYPDFLLWIIHNGKQYVNFIDPKGLRQVNGFDNPKIKFHRTLKEVIEPRLKEPDVVLNSFIVTPTKLEELTFWQDGKTLEDFERHNVYFQIGSAEYILRLLNKIFL